jgi:hypothetical protein
MDYPMMQGQSRSGFFGQYLVDPRRRAILVGVLMAVAGLAILLRPHGHATPPREGDDVATLATLVNLPAMPLSAHWAVTPVSATDAGRSGVWSLDATMVFAPSDAQRITGADVFYKPPLGAGRLMRVDDTHFRLILNTQ